MVSFLCSCGNPYIKVGELLEGEINSDSYRYVRYSDSGSYIGTFYQEKHKFYAEQSSYRITLECSDGDFAIVVDESDGYFDEDDSDIEIPHGMGTGTGTWYPGESGTITLRIYCRDEYIPVQYTILIE